MGRHFIYDLSPTNGDMIYEMDKNSYYKSVLYFEKQRSATV